MFITNTLNLSCIMQQGEAGGNNGFVPEELYGGTGGVRWDDDPYRGVREITIIYGQCIDSICVAYDRDGELVNAHRHGGNGGYNTAQIKLDYPNEFLVSVSGHYSEAPNGNAVVICSLKFESNRRRTFGPYGHENGTPFTFTVEDGGQIVGMKGRSDWYIDAIGFHIAPKRNLFRKVKEGLKRLLVKITQPLQIFQCTCISM